MVGVGNSDKALVAGEKINGEEEASVLDEFGLDQIYDRASSTWSLKVEERWVSGYCQ